MTHLPYIAAAYGLTLALIAWLAVGATLRVTSARRRLAAFEAGRNRKSARTNRPLA